MQRINEKNINTPTLYDDKFPMSLGIVDMERLNLLAKHYHGDGVYVDVGCFDSCMPPLLAERYPGADIHGIDHSPKLIAYLAERFPKVHYRIGDAYQLPFPNESVQYVVAGEVIEHLERPADFIAEAKRILRPGGWLAISTPHEEKNREVGGPAHLWAYTVEDVQKLLGTTDTMVLQESNYKTIIAWVRKS